MQANENKIIINKIGSFEIAKGSVKCYYRSHGLEGLVEITAVKTSPRLNVIVTKTLFDEGLNSTQGVMDVSFFKDWIEATEYMSKDPLFSDIKWKDMTTMIGINA